MTFDREAVRASLQDRCAQCPISEGDKLCGECPDADLGAALDEIELLEAVAEAAKAVDADLEHHKLLADHQATIQLRAALAALDRGQA